MNSVNGTAVVDVVVGAVVEVAPLSHVQQKLLKNDLNYFRSPYIYWVSITNIDPVDIQASPHYGKFN